MPGNMQGGLNRPLSPQHGMLMTAMVRKALGPTSTGTESYPEPSFLDTNESQRNYQVASRLRGMWWKAFMVPRHMVLPKDDLDGKAQAARDAEWYRQGAEPWKSHFMVTPTDPQRLNNPAHSAFVKQRQLSPPSTYGQFYAFMHALSAAFGNLSQTGQ